MEDGENKVSIFDTRKNEILAKLKKSKTQRYWRFSLQNAANLWWNYRHINLKFIPTKGTGYKLNPSIYEVVDLNNTLK